MQVRKLPNEDRRFAAIVIDYAMRNVVFMLWHCDVKNEARTNFLNLEDF